MSVTYNINVERTQSQNRIGDIKHRDDENANRKPHRLMVYHHHTHIHKRGYKNMSHENIVTLKQYCESNDLDYARARRLAHNGKFDGAFQFAKRWAIDANAPVPDFPASQSHKRADGRQRYTVYADTAERETIVALVGDGNVTNPRDVAKQRRIARKLADADANA